uniref:Centromere protein H n=1 Tax=Rhinolophus ferrumequinum TaxID=59479 RepID=A0A671FWY8_RHIFE
PPRRRHTRVLPAAAYYSCYRCGSRAPRKLPLLRGHDGQQNGVCQQGRSVSEVLRSTGLPSHSSSISQHSKGSKSPDWLMHQGPPDTAEIIKTLPQKYRRKLVSQEEIEFIQVCFGHYHPIVQYILTFLASGTSYAHLHAFPIVTVCP